MPLSRRSLLLGIGGAGVAVAAGGVLWTQTRTPTGALAPWRAASLDDPDPRLAILSFAILSANPHNRQPWLVALEDDGSATVYADPERRLPVTDPFDRQITVGFGCFLETFRIAASALGLVADISAFPEGARADRLDDRPVAHIALRAGADRDPLFDQVLARRTVKEPYDMARTPSAAELSRIADAARAFPVRTETTNDGDEVARLRDLMWRGHERESFTPAALQESVDLMRIGRAEIEASPDGIDLGGPFLEALSVAGVLSREAIADTDSEAFAQGLAQYRETIEATPAALWMVTDDDARETQLAVGRAWTRAHLEATALGLSLHPFSQTLQEYEEIADLYAEAHATLAPDGGVVQMLARVGAPLAAVNPSPRWPATSRLVDETA